MGDGGGEQDETLQAIQIHMDGLRKTRSPPGLRSAITANLQQIAYQGQRLSFSLGEAYSLVFDVESGPFDQNDLVQADLPMKLHCERRFHHGL